MNMVIKSPPAVEVWVVEPNHDLRKQLTRSLNRWERTTCTASFKSVEEARLALSCRRHPDIVLLDLPPISWQLEELSKIKNTFTESDFVLLALADDGFPHNVNGLACGIHLKTGTFEDLRNSLEQAMERRNQPCNQLAGYVSADTRITFPKPRKYRDS